jgi:cell division protein FtsL
MPSTAARKIDYTGNIAYDLSRFDRRRRVREALEREPVAYPRPIARPRERAKAAKRTAAKPHTVSAATVVGFLIVAVLMCCIVLNYMRVNELSIELSQLQTEYNRLRTEAAMLRVEHEKKFNDKRIGELAAEMGMSRPSKDQIIYVDMSQPDKGIVLVESKSKSDFLNGIKTFFFAAIDFFR